MKIDLNKLEHIYFVGIGGKGLNGMAKYCLKNGYKVSGCDTKKSSETSSISRLGGRVFDFHSKSNLDSDVDLVVYSSILESAPEIIEARSKMVPVLKRSEFLDILTQRFRRISVAGSHGKSTTTALLGLALQFAGKDPNIFCGAYINELGSYERFGAGNDCVIEACEYDRSFMDLLGNQTIITSLEKSHMEFYKNEENMNKAFKDFISAHNDHSVIYINGDNHSLRKISRKTKARLITYGFDSKNDYVILNTRRKVDSSIFNIYKNGEIVLKDLKIKIPGDYNILNFTAVVAFMNENNLSLKSILDIGQIFHGVGRRFEIKEVNKDLAFVDDFCHHPTQVKNLFDGLKQFYPNRKIIALFQPRQFHLMKTFIKEYGESFSKADEVYVTDILPALGDSEADKHSISYFDLVKSIKENGHKNIVKQIKSFEQFSRYLRRRKLSNTIITTIGAGDIYKIRDLYLQGV